MFLLDLLELKVSSILDDFSPPKKISVANILGSGFIPSLEVFLAFLI